jgi:hypothetical protein
VAAVRRPPRQLPRRLDKISFGGTFGRRQQQGIASMVMRLRHVSALGVAVALTMATSAFAEGPSEAQRAAVKSACRSDFMAHCSSVTPGGKEALECLAQHMSSLSGGCQAAVKDIEASVAPKAEPKETKEEAKPTAEPAKATEPAKGAEPAPKAASAAPSKKPSSAQIAAVKSNCRSDFMKVCSGVTPGGAAALECLDKNEARLSPSCKKAVVAASGGGGAAPAAAGTAPATANAAPGAGAAPAAAPAAPPLVLRPMRPLEVLRVTRSACGADIRTLCAGIPVGGGRIISCLAEQSASLSPACREVLAEFAAR